MQTALAFVFALALLIAVHEWGHYRMAVACGVRVLRFSIGFGPALWRWRNESGTEFVLCCLPLGGYVRMLDELEGAVSIQERHRAFNVRPLHQRAAIVAAGPLANLVLAVLLYAAAAWLGLPQALPVLSEPVVGTLAEQAGLRSGMRVQRLEIDGGEGESIESFEQMRREILEATLAGRDATLWARDRAGAQLQSYRLPLSALEKSGLDSGLFQQIGIETPWSAPVIGDLIEQGAAARAGLKRGDRVRDFGVTRVEDAQQLRRLIRDSLDPDGLGVARIWRIERAGRELEIEVKPEPHAEGSNRVGRIGAFVGSAPETVTLRQGFLGGLQQGGRQTSDAAAMTLQMLGRMVAGLASLENLSGPIAIADQAGKSAKLGPVAYLSFLALISVSLGVLNLLPLPVLDGGHLLYYLFEGLTGRPVSGPWLDRLQRAGMAVLLALMCVAIFNDIARLLG